MCQLSQMAMIDKEDVTLLPCDKCNTPTLFPIQKVNDLLRVGFYCTNCRVVHLPVVFKKPCNED